MLEHKNNLMDAIVAIVNEKGIEIINSPGIFCAIIDDIIPELDKERKIIRRALNRQVATYILEAYYSKKDRTNAILRRLDLYLEHSLGLSEEWRGVFLRAFSIAFSWSYESEEKENIIVGDGVEDNANLSEVKTFGFFSNLNSALLLAFMDLEMEKNMLAEQMFREILKKEFSCPEAYLGLMLLSSRTDWEIYLDKFKQYAPTNISDVEEQAITKKNALTLLEIYILLQDKNRIEIVAKSFPEMLNEDSFIDKAFELRSVQFLRILLEHGVSIHHRSMLYKETVSMLFRAIAESQSKDFIQLLLEFGADIGNIETISYGNGEEEKLGVLSCAIVIAKNNEIVQLLLENGVNVDTIRCYRGKEGDGYFSPLLDCISITESMEMVRLLIKHGVDVNYINNGYFNFNKAYMECTSLFYATITNNYQIVKLLLENGADVNRVCLYKNVKYDGHSTPLVESIRAKNVELSRLFVESGADVNYVINDFYDKSERRYPLIFVAINSESPEILQLLLEHGADPNALGYAGNPDFISREPFSPLSTSIRVAKNIEIIRLLIEYGADINRVVESFSPLSTSICLAKSVGITSLLIEYGADVNQVEITSFGKIPMLFYAIFEAQSIDIVKMLLDAGASMDIEVFYKGKKSSIRKFPFGKYDIPPLLLIELEKLGWKRPFWG